MGGFFVDFEPFRTTVASHCRERERAIFTGRGDGVGRIRHRRDASEDSETRSPTQVAKWVPRKNLSRKPKSAEAMELDKEEKAWQHQLYRARQAKERAEVRQALKDR